MQKPADVHGPIAMGQWVIRQAWADLKSIYYANTPIWRWLKSGALLFLGFCVWAGAAVVLSVRPDWTFLYLVMAYGFLLVFWGPLTHFGIVPLILRLRRGATHPVVRTLARHGGKINLSIFFVLVLVLAVYQPGFMLLEFAPGVGEPTERVQGSIECDDPVDGMISCEVTNPGGFDHVVVLSGDGVIAQADEEPYRVEFAVDDVESGRYLVQLRDADGNNLRTISRSV